MKKTNIAMLIVFLFILGIKGVLAKTNTLNDIVEELKQSETYEYLNNKELGLSSVIESTDNSITITYDAGEKGKVITKFSFDKDIILYQYEGNKTSPTEKEMGETLVDAMWISAIVQATAKLNGYTKEQLEAFDEDKIDNYTLAKNGLEITMWGYEEVSDAGHIAFTAYDTFMININNLKLETTSNTPEKEEPSKPEEKPNTTIETTTTTTTTENPENPNTGNFISMITLAILGLIGIISFILSNKAKRFSKI